MIDSKTGRELHIPESGEVFIAGGSGNEVLIGAPCTNVSITFNGVGNRVIIANENSRRGIIRMEINGNENEIYIGRLLVEGSCEIRSGGDKGRIEIDDMWVNEGLSILNGAELGARSVGAVCKIGKGVTAESLTLLNYHSGSEVRIGDECMIGSRVMVMNSDTHPIYSLDTGEIINRPQRSLVIGNHVWLGMYAMIMKGAVVPDGCVVGSNATVARPFEESNVILAGCPARIVRQNVRWETQDWKFI